MKRRLRFRFSPGSSQSQSLWYQVYLKKGRFGFWRYQQLLSVSSKKDIGATFQNVVDSYRDGFSGEIEVTL